MHSTGVILFAISFASVVCADSQLRFPALIPARIHRSDLCADCRILPFLAAFHTPPLPSPCRFCRAARSASVSETFRETFRKTSGRETVRERVESLPDGPTPGLRRSETDPFPGSDGCGKGRKSATFSAPRCVACRGVNRPHPAHSPAVDYSATSLSVRLRELIVR